MKATLSRTIVLHNMKSMELVLAQCSAVQVCVNGSKRKAEQEKSHETWAIVSHCDGHTILEYCR